MYTYIISCTVFEKKRTYTKCFILREKKINLWILHGSRVVGHCVTSVIEFGNNAIASRKTAVFEKSKNSIYYNILLIIII